eukprot:235595_1
MSQINKAHLDFCKMMDEQVLHSSWQEMATNIRVVNKQLTPSNAKELIFDNVTLTVRFFFILMRIYGHDFADTKNSAQNTLFANWLVQYCGKLPTDNMIQKLNNGTWWNWKKSVRLNTHNKGKKRRFDSEMNMDRGVGTYMVCSSGNEPPTKKHCSNDRTYQCNNNNNTSFSTSFR